MYTRAYWEVVNSIKGICTAAINPNLILYCVTLMYTDARRWTIITKSKKRPRGILPSRYTTPAHAYGPLVEKRRQAFIHDCKSANR